MLGAMAAHLPIVASRCLTAFLVVIAVGGAWAEAPTASDHSNFLVSGVSPSRAALITAHAEEVRAAIHARFLGAGAPPLWHPRCELHVHDTPQTFAAAVGMPPGASRGATSLEFAGDQVTLRRIDLMGDGPEPIPSALDHELVHVVLGDRFTERAPPRWADEGIAIQFDSHDKQRRHDNDFRIALDRGQVWPVRQLFTLELDPADIGRQRVFYGQSGSLVRWLLARSDSATLLAFLDAAARDGHATALQTHYGFASPEALQASWRADLPAVP